MMNSKLIKLEEICLMNLAVTDEFGSEFRIVRAHNVDLVLKQLEQMDSESPSRQISHLIYMLAKLEPFASNNKRTAMLAGITLAKRLGKEMNVKSIGGLLKHDVGVDIIESAINESFRD